MTQPEGERPEQLLTIREHQVGREMAGKIQNRLDRYVEERTGGEELASLCLEYVNHLEQHIFKEENILFRMDEGVMDRRDQESSMSCYERTEEERVGKEKHKEMLRLAEVLDSTK